MVSGTYIYLVIQYPRDAQQRLFKSKQISNSKMPKHPIESLAGEISDRFMSNASGIYGPLLNYFPAPRGSCHSFLDH